MLHIVEVTKGQASRKVNRSGSQGTLGMATFLKTRCWLGIPRSELRLDCFIVGAPKTCFMSRQWKQSVSQEISTPMCGAVTLGTQSLSQHQTAETFCQLYVAVRPDNVSLKEYWMAKFTWKFPGTVINLEKLANYHAWEPGCVCERRWNVSDRAVIVLLTDGDQLIARETRAQAM
jgi:hypothetical protein